MEGTYYLEPKGVGKKLVVDAQGVLSLDEINEERDGKWEILPVPSSQSERKGYHIRSQRYGLALSYQPLQGEDLRAIPYDPSTSTIWYINRHNEIYTDPSEKRYIWELAGNLYVTVDEYVCLSWNLIPLDQIPYPLPPLEEEGWRGSGWIILLFALLSILLWFLL